VKAAAGFQRRLNVFWSAFFVVGGVLCALSIVVSAYFSVAVVVFAICASAVGMRTFRCPACGKLVTDKKLKRGRLSLTIRLPLVAEKTCSRCGFDLSDRRRAVRGDS